MIFIIIEKILRFRVMMSSEFNKYQQLRRRSLILGVGKSLFTFLVCGKLYYLQILNKSKYETFGPK